MDASRAEPDLTTPHLRSEPVIGWRYWQVAPSGLLRSVTQRRIEWRPGQVMRARCLGAGHRAPDEGCDCGVYGARDLDTLREHGLCLAPETLVVGRIALWGRVIPDEAGWRGEYGEPASLSVVPELVPPDVGLDPLLAALGAYGVPVDTMALSDAVAGVTATTLAYQAMALQASRSRA